MSFSGNPSDPSRNEAALAEGRALMAQGRSADEVYADLRARGYSADESRFVHGQLGQTAQAAAPAPQPQAATGYGQPAPQAQAPIGQLSEVRVDQLLNEIRSGQISLQGKGPDEVYAELRGRGYAPEEAMYVRGMVQSQPYQAPPASYQGYNAQPAWPEPPAGPPPGPTKGIWHMIGGAAVGITAFAIMANHKVEYTDYWGDLATKRVWQGDPISYGLAALGSGLFIWGVIKYLRS